ncbi:hypothetical protein HN747_00645 [archaeon]|nr:hypothetical protein [archaeon]
MISSISDSDLERLKRHNDPASASLFGSKLVWVTTKPKNVAMNLFDDYYGNGHYVLVNSVNEALLEDDIKAVYIQDSVIPIVTISDMPAFKTPNINNGIDLMALYSNIGIPVAFSDGPKDFRRKAEYAGGIYVPNSYSNVEDLVTYLGNDLMDLNPWNEATDEGNHLADTIHTTYQRARDHIRSGDNDSARALLPDLKNYKFQVSGTVYDGPMTKLIQHLESGSESSFNPHA